MIDRTRSVAPSIVTLAVVLSLLLAGCTDGSSTGSTDPDDTSPTTTTGAPGVELPTIDDKLYVSETGLSAVDVDVIDNSFDERYLTVSVGTTVTWTNKGQTEHNVTPSIDGSFVGVASEEFLPGATHSVTFDQPGDYLYYCTIHGTVRNGQNGAIRVVG